MEDNRIYFHENPWPNGHKVSVFIWCGRLSSDGSLWFDLHLESENYYAEDPTYWTRDDEDEDNGRDWDSKTVWGNFHSCTMSSCQWYSGGFKVAEANDFFDLEQCNERAFHIDPAEASLSTEQDFSERAFHIYLTGHDAVADHHIQFFKNDNKMWQIDWSGKIAQTYIGHYELDYRFNAKLTGVMFSGFEVPADLSDDVACDLFKKVVSDFSQWKLIKHSKDLNRRLFTPIETNEP